MNTQITVLHWLSVVCLATLSACGGGGGAGGGSSASPGSLQFLATSFDATEGTVVNILVNRSGGSSGVVSVDYATADGTAAAGMDYPVTNGTLTYADGVSGNQTISIPITDDNAAEFSESFTVTLSNVSMASLGANSSATVNVIDNDSATLPITADNAQFITVSVFEAITSSTDLIDIADVIGLPVIASANPGAMKPASGDIITEITACDTGMITTVWDDADNNLVASTGDSFDTEFDMCFFADPGITIDGDSTIDNLVITGDPANQIAPWQLVATFGFINLIATDADGSVTIDGTLDLDISSDDNVTVNASVASASLTAREGTNSEALSNYVMTQIIDLNALTQIINANGTLTSDFLQGSVTFVTVQDFMAMGDDNPSSGQILISDSNSSVLVSVLDNMNVRLEIDLDLNGSIDETIDVTWADLDID